MATFMKRSSKQIEADLNRIKEAAKTVTTMAEIEKLTNLTRGQINTTLSKHPVVAKRIKEQIESNKALVDSLNSKPSVVSVDESVSKKTTLDMHQEDTVNIDESCQTKITKRYVIDASITATQDIQKFLNDIITNGDKLVLTSISITEIEKLQKAYGVTGFDARYIMTLAAEKLEHFEYVIIDDTLGDPDFCIIHFCKEYKEYVKNLTLLTGDKGMTARARMHGITTMYFKKSDKYIEEQEGKKISKNNPPFGQAVLPTTAKETFDVKTNAPKVVPTKEITSVQDDNTPVIDKASRELGITKNNKGELIVDTFQTTTTSIRVWSRNNMFWDRGPVKLLVGDKIMFAKLTGNEILLKVFAICSLSSHDNHRILFYKKYPVTTKHFHGINEHYRAFLSSFKKRLNL